MVMRELLVDIRQIGTSVPMGRVARRDLRSIWLCGLRGQRSRPDTCPGGPFVPRELKLVANRSANLSCRMYLFRHAASLRKSTQIL